ncbi:MAG: hypothetical protein QM811_09315 [Pirellulales bacterium]
MKVWRFTFFVFALAFLAIDLQACGGSQTKPVGVTDESHADPNARRQLPPSTQPVVGDMIGNVAERTIGPFLARKTDGTTAVAAWVTPAEAQVRRVLAIPLSGVGEPRGGANVIAQVSIDTTMIVVKPVRGPNPGFALAWTTLTDRGEALWAVVLGDDASPRSKPIEIARTTDDVVWVDIVPTHFSRRRREFFAMNAPNQWYQDEDEIEEPEFTVSMRRETSDTAMKSRRRVESSGKQRSAGTGGMHRRSNKRFGW